MTEDELPTVAEVHEVHDLIVQEWDLDHPGTRAVTPDRRLESILDDVADLDGDYRRAAALLWRLANAHVYEDGNKRTAWTVAETYLNEVGATAAPDDDVAATVMRHRSRFDESELATWLRTGEIDEERFRDDV